jgi:hypothetical protein
VNWLRGTSINRVEGRIILKWILEKWDGGMGYSNLAQDKDRWQARVNAVMNPCGEFLE